jgi:undecaprenyl-diphosphatase
MTENNPALPSGHALGSIVVLGVLAAVVLLATHRTLLRVAAVAAAALGVLTIGVSRLYLGVHWLTDVVTGWFLGGAWLAVCVTALCVLNRRRSAGQVGAQQAAVGGAQPAA